MFICFYIGHEWVSLGSDFRFRFPGDANKLRIGLTPFRFCRVKFTIIYIYLPLSTPLSPSLSFYIYIYISFDVICISLEHSPEKYI